MPGDSIAFNTPAALLQLDPPPEVVALHQLGEIAILGGLDEDGLVQLGLSLHGIEQLLHRVEQDTGLPFSQVWNSSRVSGVGWLLALDTQAQDIPDAWRLIVAGCWAVESSFLPIEYLNEGSPGTRAACLMYLAKSDVTMLDVNMTVSTVASSIAEGRVSARQSVGFTAGSFAAGAALGLATGGAGLPLLMSAINWLADRQVEVDDWCWDLALRYVLTVQLAESSPERVHGAANDLWDQATSLSRSQPSRGIARRIPLLLAVHRELLDAVGADVPEVIPVPDLLDMRLNDAKESASVMGLSVGSIVDACPPADNLDRMPPRLQSKWVVRGQHPANGALVRPGTSVSLAVSRPGERVLANVVSSKLGLPESTER